MKGATNYRSHLELFASISIHAPAKGATQLLRRRVTLLQISIHAPVKGATQSEIDKLPEVKFQSTLPRVLRTRP